MEPLFLRAQLGPEGVGTLQRNPSLTYKGALQILGKHDSPVLGALDKLLGGAILASVATPLVALWAWVDQKNEALRLIRDLTSGVKTRLQGTAGHGRHQLVLAAHTVIVIDAFFEALREIVGPVYAQLAITEDEKASIAMPSDAGGNSVRLIGRLYHADIPSPSAGRGFDANMVELRLYFKDCADLASKFLSGLAVWEALGSDQPKITPATLAARSAQLYGDKYLQLAADVPEFAIWAFLAEHSATRIAAERAQADLRKILREQSDALESLDVALRNIHRGGREQVQERLQPLRLLNQGVLRQKIVPEGVLKHRRGLSFPTVGECYVTPQFQQALSHPGARLSDESWWVGKKPRGDLSLFLTAYFVSAESTRFPLVILGDPGSGKSMLMHVLAARLPADLYTVVYVPLRRVDAEAPVYAQIEQSLVDQTHGRVDWHAISEEGRQTIRVVLLDGFDELLQASGKGNSGYLQEIAEFQRHEADMARPVVVVITTRTVVVDRARVPEGCTVLKLEEFNDEQVTQWLGTWNGVNRESIDRGWVRRFDAWQALRHDQLARQPLLLMILALYVSDPEIPSLGSEKLSTAELYERLFENYIRRELAKDANESRKDKTDSAISDYLWHLAVAAFAMFNRGRSDVAEEDLDGDFAALPDPPLVRATEARSGSHLTPAQSTLGKFFFVYASEVDAHRPLDAARSYEFLHATFGEYLVARQTIELLYETSVATRSGATSRVSRRTDDDLLFALLSHRPVSSRRTIASLSLEIFDALPAATQRGIRDTLDKLIRGYRTRRDARQYVAYNPSLRDDIAALGTYSSNLVLFRTMLAPRRRSIELATISPDGWDPAHWWKATVWLWRAALNDGDWLSVASSLVFDKRGRGPRSVSVEPANSDTATLALLGETPTGTHLKALIRSMEEAGIKLSATEVKDLCRDIGLLT